MNGERIHTAQHSRHRFGLRAQHVHVRVINRLIPLGSLGMHIHLALAVAGRLISFHDVRPQITGSAQLGDFHKILGTGGEMETHLRGNLVDAHACIRQLVQVFHAGSQRESQFLYDRRTGIVEYVTAHFNRLEVRVSSHFLGIGFHRFKRLVAASLSF